jgi:hypothetical protein
MPGDRLMHAFAHAFPADDVTRDTFELMFRTSSHLGAALPFTCRPLGALAEAIRAAVGTRDPRPAQPRSH